MIESATEEDLLQIRALLERLNLPLAGVEEHLPTMLIAREGEQIVGTAGLELYADGALLRSVAVDPGCQGKQLGHQLTDAALSAPVTSAKGRCLWFGLVIVSRPASLIQRA